jgi:multiple sugar transport system substrate-binding protein
VVFPARPEATDLAIAYNKDQRKLDVTPFTDQVKNKTTFLFPVTTNAADVTALMIPRMDAVYIGSSPVSSLTTLNDQLNNLFKVAQ